VGQIVIKLEQIVIFIILSFEIKHKILHMTYFKILILRYKTKTHKNMLTNFFLELIIKYLSINQLKRKNFSLNY